MDESSQRDRGEPLDIRGARVTGECKEVIHSMYLFLDDELSPDRRVEVRAHIERCVQCFEAFDFEAELKNMIGRKCTDTPPGDLKAKIIARLQQPE